LCDLPRTRRYHHDKEISLLSVPFFLEKLTGSGGEGRSYLLREATRPHFWYPFPLVSLSGFRSGKRDPYSGAHSWAGGDDPLFYFLLSRSPNYPLGEKCPDLRETSHYPLVSTFPSSRRCPGGIGFWNNNLCGSFTHGVHFLWDRNSPPRGSWGKYAPRFFVFRMFRGASILSCY